MQTMKSMHSVVESLARTVREVYIECHHARESARKGVCHWKPGAMWDGGVVNGATRPNIWERVAKTLLEHKLPPVPFIKFAVFDFNKRASPKPNLLLNKRVIQGYKDSIANKDVKLELENFEVAFKSQKHALRLAIAWYDDAKDAGLWVPDKTEIKQRVLLDTDTAMSALFRYCLSMSEDFEEISKQFHSLALLQYVTSPGTYNEAWGDWIPQTLRDEASVLCS